MRALVLHGPLQLRLERRPSPVLRPGHVRVALAAVGVCSSDLPRVRGEAGRFPLVLGHELAGVVTEEATDQDAVRLPATEMGAFAPGTPVTIFPLLPCFVCPSCADREFARCLRYDYFGSRRDGGLSTELDVPRWNVLPLPPAVTLEDGALTEPLAVVVHALSRLGDAASIAIVGDGFLALLALEVLRRRPVPPAVTVFGRHPDKLARAAALGAKVHGVSEVTTQLAAFPAVLEAAGAPASFVDALRLAAPGGRVVWMGNPTGDLALPAALVSTILRRELTILGTWNSRFEGTAPSDWTEALRLMSDGLRPTDQVSHRVPLEEAPTFLVGLAGGATAGPVLKALITLSPQDGGP